MKKDNIRVLLIVNTILLGLLMLIPGLMKAFSFGATGVSSMLSGIFLFSWAPLFWAWVLIIAEIGSGVAILARWKLKHVAYIPVIILGVAVLFTGINWSNLGQTNLTNLLFHLIAIANYLWLGMSSKK
jgi:uncharacterized membrane protein YphA (DoxX/SURF4 family)